MFLEDLPSRPVRITRQISAENPTGEPGNACRWDPDHPENTIDHGKGLKVHPFLQLEPGETKQLADIDGSGSINEFFITTEYPYLSELILRIYWDFEDAPSVGGSAGYVFCQRFR